MNFGKQRNAGYLILGLVLIVIFSRLVPHAPNFTGSLAAIIFCAIALRSWKAFVTIILAYLFTDLIINNIFYRHNHFVWFTPDIYWILVPYGIVFMANLLWFKNELKPMGIITSSLFSSTIFFIFSNFGEWLTSKLTYAHDISGLSLCYFNALPFFGYEIAGSLFYSSVIFSVYWLYFYEYRSYEFSKRG